MSAPVDGKRPCSDVRAAGCGPVGAVGAVEEGSNVVVGRFVVVRTVTGVVVVETGVLVGVTVDDVGETLVVGVVVAVGRVVVVGAVVVPGGAVVGGAVVGGGPVVGGAVVGGAVVVGVVVVVGAVVVGGGVVLGGTEVVGTTAVVGGVVVGGGVVVLGGTEVVGTTAVVGGVVVGGGAVVGGAVVGGAVVGGGPCTLVKRASVTPLPTRTVTRPAEVVAAPTWRSLGVTAISVTDMPAGTASVMVAAVPRGKRPALAQRPPGDGPAGTPMALPSTSKAKVRP